ncbi:MAG TPA: M4 family metallopeptidase [Holophagaceae bacterium]|nr:M4 family metallopeptidase [Holophagaceae bacterium]
MILLRGRRALPVLAAILVAAPAVAMQPVDATTDARVTAATARLMALRESLGLGEEHAFRARTAQVDEKGELHARFQQTYKGVRVWGGEAITHTDANGRFLAPTLAPVKGISLNPTPSIEASEALAAAHRDLAPKGPYAVEPSAELVVYPETTLVHVRPGEDATAYEEQVVRHHLAYHVHAQLENGKGETIHRDYMIDAHTGAILKQWNSLRTGAVVGTGKSQWYGTVSLNTNLNGSTYEMKDMTRGTGGTFGANATTNLNHATSGNGTLYTDADNAWGDGNGYGSGTTTSTTSATGQTAAVDQHHGMAVTWDFYKNVLGRNGIDGTGKAAYGRMHYSSNYDNAFWDDTCFCMTYGDGNPPSGSYGEADLDTVGHEMSHGVCSTTANLTYSGESGGLNESNSDIFGTCVEFYTLGANATGSVVPDSPGTGTVTANYTMFENSWGHPGQALRYMYKPSLDGSSPDAWSSTIGSLDVHYSSGPNNRMFYFLARGSSATSTSDYYTSYLPSGMTGIGNDHAARIWWRALSVYMTSSTNYAGARTAALSAASDLYGTTSAEYAAVQNAFHGINVGAAAGGGSTALSAAVSSPSGNISINVGATVAFTGSASGGTSPYTYSWTFGDGATSTAASTSHTYTAAGTYTATFKVTDSTGATSSVSRTITANPVSTTTFSEVEANNTIATANAVASSFTAITGTMTTTTDVDYFALTLLPGQKITINMTGPTGPDWDLYLKNSAGTTLASSTGSTTTESLSYTNSGTTNMTVYAETLVYATASTSPYTLALTYAGGTPSDTTPPSVSATESGTSGTITLSASATDNVSVTKVEFYVDGVLKGTDTSSPFSMTLDSTTLVNGSHSLVAKAYDAMGNVGTSTTVSFSISNPTAALAAAITTPSSNVVVSSGTAVSFAGTSTGGTSPVTYTWAFGDGATATGATATHTFPAASGDAGQSYTVTFTAKDSLGATASATRTVTVNPIITSTELVTNGGFESSTTGWSGTTGDIGSFTGEPAHAGTRDCWLLGNGSTATESIQQSFAIPAGANPTLTFWLHIDTAETTTTTAYDTLKVQVLNASGTVLGTLATYSNLNKATGYSQKSFSLGAYAGQTVTIKFLGAEDSSLQTSFVLDDVSAK